MLHDLLGCFLFSKIHSLCFFFIPCPFCCCCFVQKDELQQLRAQLKTEKSLRRNVEQQFSALRNSARSHVQPPTSATSATSTATAAAVASSSSLSIPQLPPPTTAAMTTITRRQPRRAVALYTDFDCFFHQTPSTHPETSQRVIKLWERLYTTFDQRIDWCTNSPRVSVNMLFNVHSPQYIHRFLAACKYLTNNNVPKNFMLCCQGASAMKGHSHKKGKQLEYNPIISHY